MPVGPAPTSSPKGLPVAIALAALVAMAGVGGVQGTSTVFPVNSGGLTGDVRFDFPVGNPNVWVVTDSKPPLQFLGGGRNSGWNIDDLRFAYDTASDTGYFGTS